MKRSGRAIFGEKMARGFSELMKDVNLPHLDILWRNCRTPKTKRNILRAIKRK